MLGLGEKLGRHSRHQVASQRLTISGCALQHKRDKMSAKTKCIIGHSYSSLHLPLEQAKTNPNACI